MAPGKKNLSAYRFYDFVITFEYSFQLDDYTFFSEVRDIEGNKVADFTIMKANEMIIMRLTKEQMSAIIPNVCEYDVKRVDTAGQRYIDIEGTITFKNGKTHNP